MKRLPKKTHQGLKRDSREQSADGPTVQPWWKNREGWTPPAEQRPQRATERSPRNNRSPFPAASLQPPGGRGRRQVRQPQSGGGEGASTGPPTTKRGIPSIPTSAHNPNNISLFISSRRRRPLGRASVALLHPPPVPLLLREHAYGRASVCERVSVSARVCVFVSVFGPERARRDTYGRVEGEGALALEDPVSRAGHPDGGHIGDQQLSQVCSHLRIPASGTTVLPSQRSRRLSVEKDAIFKALRRYIPAAEGT